MIIINLKKKTDCNIAPYAAYILRPNTKVNTSLHELISVIT